jgi:3-(3-hydroxy-phenyl)propionate hydroxylase
MLPDEVDVLLVGLGPVGAAAANLFGRYGVRTLAIDKARNIHAAPRAVMLDNEALRILQMAGLEEGEFATRAIPRVEMHSPLFGNYGHIDCAGQVDGHPQLVTFFQPELERVLRAHIALHSSVHVAPDVELAGYRDTDRGVLATLNLDDGRTHQVMARYMLGADGPHSRVRQLAGIAFEDKTLTQDWLVVDAIDHVKFICDPPGKRQRWEFMLQPGETRIVERFSQGRVFLAGDAAHPTPPFAGQGLAAGLRDVANLCWKLAWVTQGRAGPAILDSYDAERRPHAKAVIRTAMWMGRLVMPRNRLAAFGVHGLMMVLQAIPFVRPWFQALRFRPGSRFGRGLFQPGGSGSRLQRGAPLPQCLVRRSPEHPCVLSDRILADSLTLVGFGCDPAPLLSPGVAAAWKALGGRIVHIRHRGQDGHSERSWEDMTNTLVPQTAPPGWIAVVRPDRTVLHDGPVALLDPVLMTAISLLQLPAPASALCSRHAGQRLPLAA